MKKGMSVMRFVIAFISFVFLFSISSMAETNEPGDPGLDPIGDPPLGGGAPAGSGTLILIGLGVTYGGRKTYKLYQDSKKELKD